MAFVFIDPARRKKRKVAKSEASQAVLDALDAYLEGNIDEPMKWLVAFWKDQSAALTYRELLSIVTDEAEPQRLFDTWFQDYSKLLQARITPMWQGAFLAGANTTSSASGIAYQVNTAETSVREWILNRGAELVTNVTQDQTEAVKYIIAEAQANRMGTAEAARYIRPTVGLTEQQAEANLKLYNTTKEKLRAEHPRMTDEAVERKARTVAGRYAQKQQMTRAETIARTEIATAYNQGADAYVRQAMNQGLMPIMRKVWSTAADGHVCPACEDLEGVEIDMDSEFKVTVGKKVQRELSVLLPPIHPRCKCAVMYEETGEYVQKPVENPEEDDTIMSEDQFRDQTEEKKRNREQLTPDQIEEAKTAAKRQGYDGEIYYSPFMDTSFHGSIEGDPFHYLVIGTDAYPAKEPGDTANERVSMNGCIAHEVVGHYEAWKKGTTKEGVLEEAQASIRAARFGVDLTEEERDTLWRDAMERLKKAEINFEDVSESLDIHER